MSTVPCKIAACDKPALIGTSTCMRCHQYLCCQHYDDLNVHTCSIEDTLSLGTERAETRDLIAEIDIEALIAEASVLRPGHSCTGPKHSDLQRDDIFFGHGCNLHIILVFDDGVRWLVRFRKRRAMAPSLPALRLNLESEFATLKALKAAGIVVPNVWKSNQSHGSTVLYFFEEYITGEPDETFTEGLTVEPNETTLSYVRQIAELNVSLSEIRFDKVGSLHPNIEGDGQHVGPVIHQWPSFGIPPYFPGPYDTAKSFLASIDRMLQETREGVRYPQSQVYTGYLALLEARSLVEHCDGLEDGEYFIKHGEDKGDIWLFDSEGRMTGVIDWEWSYITCKGDAFAAPYGLTCQIFDSRGLNTLCPFELALVNEYERLGRSDLAQAVSRGKRFQRLGVLLNHLDLRLITLNATRRAFLDQPDGIAGEPATLDEWARVTRKRIPEDDYLNSTWPE